MLYWFEDRTIAQNRLLEWHDILIGIDRYDHSLSSNTKKHTMCLDHFCAVLFWRLSVGSRSRWRVTWYSNYGSYVALRIHTQLGNPAGHPRHAGISISRLRFRLVGSNSPPRLQYLWAAAATWIWTRGLLHQGTYNVSDVAGMLGVYVRFRRIDTVQFGTTR